METDLLRATACDILYISCGWTARGAYYQPTLAADYFCASRYEYTLLGWKRLLRVVRPINAAVVRGGACTGKTLTLAPVLALKTGSLFLGGQQKTGPFPMIRAGFLNGNAHALLLSVKQEPMSEA